MAKQFAFYLRTNIVPSIHWFPLWIGGILAVGIDVI
jgi:hypothetical protein